MSYKFRPRNRYSKCTAYRYQGYYLFRSTKTDTESVITLTCCCNCMCNCLKAVSSCQVEDICALAYCLFVHLNNVRWNIVIRCFLKVYIITVILCTELAHFALLERISFLRKAKIQASSSSSSFSTHLAEGVSFKEHPSSNEANCHGQTIYGIYLLNTLAF